jgi:trimethylamine:corrinoid methyltransferase-like protein
MPSELIDRGSLRAWKQKGSNGIFSRAKDHVKEMLANYQPTDSSPALKNELRNFVSTYALEAGMDTLPKVDV